MLLNAGLMLPVVLRTRWTEHGAAGHVNSACFTIERKENLVWPLLQTVMRKMKYEKADALCKTSSAAERRKNLIHTGF